MSGYERQLTQPWSTSSLALSGSRCTTDFSQVDGIILVLETSLERL